MTHFYLEGSEWHAGSGKYSRTLRPAIVAVLQAKLQLTGTLFISSVCTPEFIERSKVWHMESCGYETEGFNPEDRRRLIR